MQNLEDLVEELISSSMKTPSVEYMRTDVFATLVFLLEQISEKNGIYSHYLEDKGMSLEVSDETGEISLIINKPKKRIVWRPVIEEL